MKLWPLVIAVSILLIPIARAETLIFEIPISANDTPRVLSSYHPSTDLTKNSEAGEVFIATSNFKVSRAVFEIQRLSSSVTVNLRVVLYDSLSGTYGSSSTPSDVNSFKAASDWVLAANIPAGSTNQISFIFPAPPELLNTRQYAISVTMDTTGTIDLGYQVYFDFDNGYAGNLFIYADGYAAGSNDHGLQLYGTLVEGFAGPSTSQGSSPDILQTDQPSALPVVGGSTLLVLGLGLAAYLGLVGRKRGTGF